MMEKIKAELSKIPWWGWVVGIVIVVIIIAKLRSNAAASSPAAGSSTGANAFLNPPVSSGVTDTSGQGVDPNLWGLLTNVATGTAAADQALGVLPPELQTWAPPPPTKGPTGISSSIGTWYTDILGRTGDSMGANYWLGLSTGPNAETFQNEIAAFAGSGEAQSHANVDPTGFVQGLYNVVLNRNGTSQEINYWTGQLRTPSNPKGPMTAGQVATAIAGSPEAQTRFNATPVSVVA